MRIHGLVGSQFGDMEFDVGRSVRWLEYFVDTMHITDVNLGSTRYFVVNWARTFKDSKSRDVYLPHAAHKEFVALALPKVEKVLVVDYFARK